MPPQCPDLSILIPAFNEENRLGDSLERILDFVEIKGIHHETLVIDDGSSDRTYQVAESFKDRGTRTLRLDINQGKGAALRLGVLESRGRSVLLTDADLSTPIEDLDTLKPFLERSPIVFGSRAVHDSRVTLRQPFYRDFMGKTFNKMIRLAGIRGIQDTQCGFKLLNGEVARELFSRLITPGFAYDVELTWLARKLGYEVVEVGVRWENSLSSRVHPLLDPPKMLWEILRFRLHHRGL